MIKAKGTLGGKDILMLGLSFGNLNRFLAEPGDTFIRIKGEDLNIPFDIIIYSGETEADCAKQLEKGFGPDTILHVN